MPSLLAWPLLDSRAGTTPRKSVILFVQLDQSAREQVLRLNDSERAPSTLSSLYMVWEDIIVSPPALQGLK